MPQAELLREEIVSFFLAGISMTICCISIDIIINSYVLTRILFDVAEGWMSEKVIIYLLSDISTLCHLCYSAHLFSRQVSGVSDPMVLSYC